MSDVIEEVRYCAYEGCGKPLTRRADESQRNADLRKTCGRVCAEAAGLYGPRFGERVGVCVVCGGPVHPDKRGRIRKTCGQPECLAQLIREGQERTMAERALNPNWREDAQAKPREEPGWDFRGQDVEDHEQGVYFRKQTPDNRSYAGCSMGWTSGQGGE